MSVFALEVGDVRATTCLLAGRVDDTQAHALSGFRHVLWLVDAAGVEAAPAELHEADVTIEAILVEHTSQLDVLIAVQRLIARDPVTMPAMRITSDVTQHYVEHYEALFTAVRSIMDEENRARVTRQADAVVWQQHLLRNLRSFVSSRVPKAWEGSLAGIPAMVCGAGPSLSVSVEALARTASRGIVFAADSALRTLARHGVAVDFGVSIDPFKVPERCLPFGVLPGRMVLSSVSPPGWVEAAGLDRCAFVSGRQVTEDWLQGMGVPRTPVAATESCGSTALELARFLGCSPIVVFGMDMAVSGDATASRRVSDADQAMYRDAEYGQISRLPGVPGNYEPEVPTHVLSDWQALHDRLLGWPEDLLVNVTDRGARLGAARVVHPCEFVLEGRGALRPVLESLTAPERCAVGAIGVELCHHAATGRDGVARARRMLAESGVASALVELRTLFGKPGFSDAFGAFSMKILPMLVGDTAPRAQETVQLVDELERLCDSAEDAGRELSPPCG